MATSFQLTAQFDTVDEGWIQGRIVEIPGVITAAPTIDEAKEMLGDALREYMLAMGELDDPDGTRSREAGQPVLVTLDL